MANGTDSEEFLVLSRVRTGLKREFAFALKVQSEIGGSLGRTRSRKAHNGALGNGVSDNSSNKRLKSSDSKDSKKKGRKTEESFRIVVDSGDLMSEEEAKSDVVDLTSDEERKNIAEEVISNGILENHVVEIVEEEILMRIDKPKDDQPNDNVKLINVDMPKEDQACKCESKEDQKKKSEAVIILNKDDEKVKNVVTENPFRRYTRSALKQKMDAMNKFEQKIGMEESEMREIANDDNDKAEGVSNQLVGPMKLEMKMSKKIALKKFPTKLRDFLEMGLLDGLPVQYIRGSKAKAPGPKGLRGVIKGSGILCYCDSCEGNEVVTPTEFELHAGSANKRPPEYIYLANGNTLRDVMNACKNAPLDSLEESIRNVVTCSAIKKTTICLNCKVLITGASTGKTTLLCGLCAELKESPVPPTRLMHASDESPSPVSVPKSPDTVPKSPDAVPKSAGTVPKSAGTAPKCSSSRVKSQGRLTRKDLRLHKLVFEEDVLPDGTELAYYSRGQKLLVGYKKGFGIFCTCCNSEISASQFEAHAGWASRRKPYLNIYTSNGVSLHELSISLTKGRKLSSKDNDDVCSICLDGGNLVCCDACPRVYHKECVNLPRIPSGIWYCKFCQNMFQREKFVEHNANAVAAGRVAGVDPIEQITKRCIRIVKTPEAEVGVCVLCRCTDFCKSGFSPLTVIICDQCEKEYHVGCLKDHQMDDLKELPEGKWFCCTECDMIHSALQKLVVNGEKKLPVSLLNVMKNKHEEKGSESVENLDIRWRILSGKLDSSGDAEVLLSKAVDIFHDHFSPINDSAGCDLIPSMVNGKSVMDQECGGMYCAVLTVNKAVVSAGIFRVFGREVAELPLVATRTDFQGQGYFKSLYSCIEDLLSSLNVRTLVLPAAEEAVSIWTTKFGFQKITQNELKKYNKHYQMMVFQRTSVLCKPVPKCMINGK